VSGQRNIRLLLADVDGTLVTEDKVLTEAAKTAARELHEAGIALAITSGRPPRGMRMLIEPLAMQVAIAGFNGGVLVNPDLSVIESHTLDSAIARKTVELILSQGLDAWVYTAQEWLIRRLDAPHVAREAWTVKFDATVVPSFTDAHLAHTVKVVGVSDDLAVVATCEKAVQDVLGHQASAERSQPYYLDVTHRQANKGAVVATLPTAGHSARADRHHGRHAERRAHVPQERLFHRHGERQRRREECGERGDRQQPERVFRECGAEARPAVGCSMIPKVHP
jgi:HAD superfamily hydrolase (TIGR01484 family)